MDKWLRKVDHYSPVSLFWAGLAVGFSLALLLSRSSPATKDSLAQTLPQRPVPTASNPRTPVPGAYLNGDKSRPHVLLCLVRSLLKGFQ
jgi:hypothetical protein